MNDIPEQKTHNVEIETTPKMIEAGLEQLLKYRYDWSNDEEVVNNIFKAMISMA